MVHAQAGDRLEHIETSLSLAKRHRHDRQRSEFHASGSDRHQVRGDPVDFHDQHAQV
jgi:hypothetical protein